MILKRSTQVFLGLIAIAFCKVGIEALIDPRAVVAQAGIMLDNPSALSSMRAVYGGMHLVFGLFCVYGIFRDLKTPLIVVALYSAGFVLGRISGIVADGTPNEFVITWLATEAVCLGIAVVLIRNQKLTAA